MLKGNRETTLWELLEGMWSRITKGQVAVSVGCVKTGQGSVSIACETRRQVGLPKCSVETFRVYRQCHKGSGRRPYIVKWGLRSVFLDCLTRGAAGVCILLQLDKEVSL